MLEIRAKLNGLIPDNPSLVDFVMCFPELVEHLDEIKAAYDVQDIKDFPSSLKNAGINLEDSTHCEYIHNAMKILYQRDHNGFKTQIDGIFIDAGITDINTIPKYANQYAFPSLLIYLLYLDKVPTGNIKRVLKGLYGNISDWYYKTDEYTKYVANPLESQKSPIISKSDSDVPLFPLQPEFTSEALIKHSLSFGFDWLLHKIRQLPGLSRVKLTFDQYAPSISANNKCDVLFYHEVDSYRKMIPLIAGEIKTAEKWGDALLQLKFTTLMPSHSFGELQFFFTVGGCGASIIFNDPIGNIYIKKDFSINQPTGYSEFFVTLFNLVKSFAKAPPHHTKVNWSFTYNWSSITYAIPDLYVVKTFFSTNSSIVRSRYHHLSQLFGKFEQVDIFHGHTIPDNYQTRLNICNKLELSSTDISLNKCVGVSRISPIFERPKLSNDPLRNMSTSIRCSPSWFLNYNNSSSNTHSSFSNYNSSGNTRSSFSNYNCPNNTPYEKKPPCWTFLIINPFIPDIPTNFNSPISTFQFIKTLHKYGITHNDLRRPNIINGYVIDYEYATAEHELTPSDMILIRNLKAWDAFSKQFSSIVTFPDCSFILLCFYDLYTLCNSLCYETEEFDLFIQELITSSTSFSQQELNDAYEKAEKFF